MGFFKALGHSDWWRLFGLLLRYDDGGLQNFQNDPLQESPLLDFRSYAMVFFHTLTIY